MPQLVDCYVLVNTRNHLVSSDFLNTFLPIRKISSDDFPYPQYSNENTNIFSLDSELFNRLEIDEHEAYSIYYENIEKKDLIKHCMIFYTDDANMILGMSIAGASIDDTNVLSIYNKLKKKFKSEIGCITVEENPPLNSKDFIGFCNDRF